MLGVRLIQADLTGVEGASKRTWDPFAVVKCEKTRKYSKAVTDVSTVDWPSGGSGRKTVFILMSDLVICRYLSKPEG